MRVIIGGTPTIDKDRRPAIRRNNPAVAAARALMVWSARLRTPNAVSNLTPEEAVIIVNAYGETLESLAALSSPRWETDEAYRRDVMNSPDPVSLFRRTHDISLLPYSKNGIREALQLLLAHADVDAEMKERLRMGLIALDDFVAGAPE